MLRTGWGDLTLDSEGEEIHGGTGGGPPLRAQRWCWMGSSTGSVNEELDEDLHREELDGVHGRGASRRPPRGGARWGRGWGAHRRPARGGARWGHGWGARRRPSRKARWDLAVAGALAA
jgi:hypothetical protein